MMMMMSNIRSGHDNHSSPFEPLEPWGLQINLKLESELSQDLVRTFIFRGEGVGELGEVGEGVKQKPQQNS